MTKEPKKSPKAEADSEAKRERALRETFPASDPVQPEGNTRTPLPSPRRESRVQNDLDESLEETFPASDPPSIVDPDHKPPRP